ncbi:MAG TPA: ABC transporter permease [Hyphomicrobiaceae bacterium]|jgi:peptide/nickel transport system permease protein|nr:ABC transporter permease [Hyphomicrobiaceae bacterium]
MGTAVRLVVRRLSQLLPIIVFATLVVFALLQLVPGDPALILAGDYASKERIEEIRQLYGFDRPLIVQYFSWFWKVLHGDLGNSLLSSAPVLDLILQRMPNTILIAVYALTIAAAVGISLGVLAATRVGSTADAFVTSTASLGVALPSFWLAILLVATFALDLHLFPATGARPFTVSPGEAIRHATLPAIALAVGVIAELARQVRSALVEVLNSQYVRTLRAKGLGPMAILWKHGLRNISVTLLTLIGLQVNRLFSGAVVIEAVFAIPGAGNLVAYSAINKDFPVVQGTVLVFVVIVILVNLTVDILNALLDPRVAEE